MRNVSLAAETISRENLESTANWLLSGPQLTKGPETLKFEAEFASKIGAPYAVFVNSGSSANLLVAATLLQSGKLRNQKVVCPAVSWVTTVTPFSQLGFEVFLCEADEQSLGLDVAHLLTLIEEHDPAVIVLVHVLGHPNDMALIRELAEKHDILLIEDTCEALGSTTSDGTTLGTIGIAGTFSFYYGHHISTIEGGMVVTSDYDFFQLALSIRSHGWSRDLGEETKKSLTTANQVDPFRNFYTFYYEGFNLRPTDLQAFIGRMQLEKIDEIITRRRDNFSLYKSLLPGFWPQDSAHEVLSSFAYGTFVSNPERVAMSLAAGGIESRPLICGNIARQPFWLKEHPPVAFPVADLVHDHGIYLPNHAELTRGDIEYVAAVFSSVAVPL